MNDATAVIYVERFCQATGEMIELDCGVSGSWARPDPAVGDPGGIEDLDVAWLEVNGTRLSHGRFELTPAEEAQAVEALEEELCERAGEAAIAAWEARHG